MAQWSEPGRFATKDGKSVIEAVAEITIRDAHAPIRNIVGTHMTGPKANELLDAVKRAFVGQPYWTWEQRTSSVTVELLQLPVIGSRWQHKNGNLYEVYDVTNEFTERHDEYPVTISYRGENGRKWSRAFWRWHSSMTELPNSISP